MYKKLLSFVRVEDIEENGGMETMAWKSKRAKLRSLDWILSAPRNNQSLGAEGVLDLTWVSGRSTWYDGYNRKLELGKQQKPWK